MPALNVNCQAGQAAEHQRGVPIENTKPPYRDEVGLGLTKGDSITTCRPPSTQTPPRSAHPVRGAGAGAAPNSGLRR